MSCTGSSDCLCGCCAGTSVQTPALETNLPGLPAIVYRAGTWASFKESMLARLSSSDYPALAGLKTRDDDDFTVAFLDATAVVLDILTFYQERLANESYLRTATQLRSLTELSRLIGYRPRPGVAASAYLAFTLQAAPGQPPDPTTPAITIPAGSGVQSIPAQGQKAQVFETSADIQAKPDWNALPVQTSQPWQPPGSGSVYLSGTTTQLNLGDVLLILGVAREGWAPSSTPNEQWDVVVINDIQVDSFRKLTYVAWNQPLQHETSGTSPAWTSAKIFALRQKAALFGNNAPNPNLFVDAKTLGTSAVKTSLPALIDDSGSSWQWSWNNFQIPSASTIYLDAAYPKIVAGGWFALANNGSAQLYKAQQMTTTSLAQYAIAAKVTELTADFNDPNISATFPLQGTEVWAQSDELTIAPQPLDYPLYGKFIDLQALRPDLVGAQAVALSGNRQKLAVADGVTGLLFYPDDGSDPTGAALNPGDVLTVTSPVPLPLDPDFSVPDWSTVTGSITLNVEDANGRPGTVTASALSDFGLAPSSSSDPEVGEYAIVVSATSVLAPYPHTQILLKSALINCYDRNSATVNANVGLATNGQSVSEIMGSGSASTPNQSFTLKQSPLTYVQAPTANGMQSTLQVRANGVAWAEVPSLYQQPPSAQVFATLNNSDGTTDVIFGDGVEGAMLPTGQNNVQSNYRIGSGSAGNVAAGAISMLMDRPVGVSGVTNPSAATGGQDPDSIDGIRTNAPQTVLTLGRAVSISDYQSFAATYASIAKAYAIWIPYGPARGVFLTVAGVDGAALPQGGNTLNNLVASLQSYGNPLIPILAQSFLETLFGLSADVAYDPAYDQPTVQNQILATLSAEYSFAQRTFGQGVSLDEVATVIQSVPGVIAVNVISLTPGPTSAAGDLASQPGGYTLANYNNWLAQQVPLTRPFSSDPTRICAYVPVATSQGLPLPAEILVLNPDPTQVALGVMS